MRAGSFNLPLHSAGRGVALAGLWLVCKIAVVLLFAVWMLLVVILRLLRSIILVPLLLVMVGAIVTACVFAWTYQWKDAAEAVAVAMMFAGVLLVYSLAATGIDPDHFEPRPIPSWKRYL